MKIAQLTFVAIILAATNLTVKADNPTSAEKTSVQYATTTYIDAFAHGRIKGFADMIDENARFTVTRNERIISYSKTEILESLSNTKNAEQNCTVKASVAESIPGQVVVKVNMYYPGFNKINLVTLAQSDKGWKITHVSSSFQ